MSLVKKYYQDFFSELIDVNVVSYPIFLHGLLITDKRDNTILLYQDLNRDVVNIVTRVKGQNEQIERCAFDGSDWQVLSVS